MKKVILLILSLICSNLLNAQRTCGSEINMSELRSSDPARYNRLINFERVARSFTVQRVNGRVSEPLS